VCRQTLTNNLEIGRDGRFTARQLTTKIIINESITSDTHKTNEVCLFTKRVAAASFWKIFVLVFIESVWRKLITKESFRSEFTIQFQKLATAYLCTLILSRVLNHKAGKFQPKLSI